MGHPLARFRQEHGLSQVQLAAMLGVTGVTVSRWETGQRQIGSAQIPEINRLTGIPAEQLRPDLAELFAEVNR